MKYLSKILIYSPLLLTIVTSLASAENFVWKNAPTKWTNSPANFSNSAYDFKNSPNNWKNSSNNSNRLNIVNILGVTIGYAVNGKNGYVNYFDNSGNRIGYSRDGGKTQFNVAGEVDTFKVKRNS